MKNLHKYVADLYRGSFSMVVTMIVAIPPVMLLSVAVGFLVRVCVWAFNIGFLK